jgi:YbbR domain-containing protein
VEIDKISKGTRNLSVTTTGKAASGYIAEEPECDVDKVTISGPASLVNNVAKVQATIDISGKTSLTEQSVEVFALDSQDEIIKEFKVDPQYVKIKVNVRKQGFLKINEPITIGQLPEGLKLESIDWYPKTIDVTGKSSALETMSLLKLPVIDLNGISSSVSYNYSVNKLLDGTDLTSDTDNIVVTVNVVPADDGADIIPLTIAPNDITILSLPQDTNCTIDSVDIELQGDLKTIEALTPQELNPIINLTGFDVGSHSITVNLTLPEGITAAKNTANITISEGSSETLTETTTAEETTETEKETEDESQSEADVIDEDSEKE